MMDFFKTYRKKDPYYIRVGFMLLIFSLVTWIMKGTDSYLNAGVLMFAIYLIQSIIEALDKKKDEKNALNDIK